MASGQLALLLGATGIILFICHLSWTSGILILISEQESEQNSDYLSRIISFSAL